MSDESHFELSPAEWRREKEKSSSSSSSNKDKHDLEARAALNPSEPRTKKEHKRSQSKDVKAGDPETLTHTRWKSGDYKDLNDPHNSSDHHKAGALEKLTQKFENVLKGNTTVSNFRGEYTGKINKDTGKYHGKGTLVTPTGDRYIGEWVEGELHGFGQYFGKEEMYEGEWRQGKIEGVGKFRWSNCDEYEGQWRDSKAEGRGTYVWKNGDRYEGEWHDNKKSGRGKKTFVNGDEYNGEWRNDRPHGRGTYSWKNGDRYEGDWLDGKKSGKGTKAFTAGEHYTGEWRNDEYHGHGTLTLSNGDIYEGEFAEGKRHGTGTLTRKSSGDRYRGDWEDDKRHGVGRETLENGTARYEGQYRLNQPDGFGVYTTSRGERYEGEWRAGKRHGLGIWSTANGERYEGYWLNGTRHGFGTYHNAKLGETAEVECRGDDVIERRPEERPRCLDAARDAQKAAAEARKLTTDSQRLKSSNSQPSLPTAIQLAAQHTAAAPVQMPPVVLPAPVAAMLPPQPALAAPLAPAVAPAPLPATAVAPAAPAPAVSVSPPSSAESRPPDEKIASSIYVDFSELQLEPRPLGEGSYGVVYKGTFRGLPVAVKVLKINPSKAIQQRLEDEFLKEVKMLAELRHPNIILFMGATTKPHFCFVTEFMPKGNLFEHLANPAVIIDDPTRLKMAKDIALGMVYLHQRKPPIIHKDLKSLNILVDEQNRLKIGDFGLSIVKEAVGDEKKGNMIGTPQWCAPELLRNDPYDEKVDVYSFGILLWELVARQGPYPTLSPDQVRIEVLTNGLRPVPPPNTPPPLRQLMERCWQSDPVARPSFSTIIEIINQLQAEWHNSPAAAQHAAAQAAQAAAAAFFYQQLSPARPTRPSAMNGGAQPPPPPAFAQPTPVAAAQQQHFFPPVQPPLRSSGLVPLPPQQQPPPPVFLQPAPQQASASAVAGAMGPPPPYPQHQHQGHAHQHSLSLPPQYGAQPPPVNYGYAPAAAAQAPPFAAQFHPPSPGPPPAYRPQNVYPVAFAGFAPAAQSQPTGPYLMLQHSQPQPQAPISPAQSPQVVHNLPPRQ